MSQSPSPALLRPNRKTAFTPFSDKLSDSLNDIAAIIQQHKEMIDTIQELALELTGAINNLHILTVNFAAKANQFLDLVLPLIKNLPIFPKKATALLAELEKWTQKLIDNETQTGKAVTEVRAALHSGDVARLKGHTNEIKNMTKNLAAILPRGK